MYAALLILFFLSSCSKPCTWEYQTTSTCYPEFDSKRLFLSRHHPATGIDVEIINTACEKRIYLNFPSYPVQNTCDIIATIDGKKQVLEWIRFEGGQRILLTYPSAQLIIDSLLAGRAVMISTGLYTEVITPVNFGPLYRALL